MKSKEKVTTKTRRVIIFCLFNLIVVPIVFFLIEGISSSILFYQAISKTQPWAEAAHTEYDEQLGWVNLPNLHIEDMYGPGIYMKTNSQRFRNDEDFTETVPRGKIRVICSGDSFTLGYGVNNDQTWCQQLRNKDDRLQTVNMGQGGYGVDQAYLWYKRDGLKLEHDFHLFAFITNDFQRMDFDEFVGYGKPILKVQDEALVIDNVPAPRFPAYIHWIIRNRLVIGQLKSVQLLNSLRSQPANNELPQNVSRLEKREVEPIEEQGPEIVASKIFADLQQINQAKNSTLVLIYLPTLNDYDKVPAETEKWRKYVRQASQRMGIVSIDLVDEFRKLPRYQVTELFIPPGALVWPGAAGHYSAKGNAYVAELLYEKLLSLPESSNRLAKN